MAYDNKKMIAKYLEQWELRAINKGPDPTIVSYQIALARQRAERSDRRYYRNHDHIRDIDRANEWCADKPMAKQRPCLLTLDAQ